MVVDRLDSRSIEDKVIGRKQRLARQPCRNPRYRHIGQCWKARLMV